MRGPSLFSKIRRESHYRIRLARNDDWPAIERLLYHARRCYTALEWWQVEEWLGSPTLLLAADRRGYPVGLMLAITGNGPVSWLRAIAASADGCLLPLLEASAQAVLAQGGTGLAFLGSEDWILSQLRPAGFRLVNRVVTLRRSGAWPLCHGPPGLHLRAATPADLDAVLAVDHAAFPPLWWYGRQVLRRALDQASCFDVAYLNRECVGYQFSTLRHGRGHIVRLATHPHWQHQGIGGCLLSRTMLAFERAGAEPVTVNTQDDNLASLRLYRRFAFERVGNPWLVWFQSMA